MRTDVVFCIGTGKNAAYFEKLNVSLGLFDRIIALEHPRYIMQYKAKQIDSYVRKYASALAGTDMDGRFPAPHPGPC